MYYGVRITRGSENSFELKADDPAEKFGLRKHWRLIMFFVV